MIRVIIADDHSIIRESIKKILDLDEDIQVVGTAVDGFEAVELTKKLKVDMVLMDAVMPNCNGVEATKLIKSINNNIKVLMLTTFSDDQLIINAFDAGVNGYILKDVTAPNLIHYIQEANLNHTTIPYEIASKLVSLVLKRHLNYNFNDTELEIIDCLIKGKSNKEIAQALNISYGTTRNYISDIYQKIGQSNRQNAINQLKQHHY